MKNINDLSAHHEIINRVRLLSSANIQLWGKMNLQQMLAHCTTQLKLALGEVSSTKQGSFVMRSTIGKWIAFSNIPWPKGSNTPNEMNVEKNHFVLTDIESEKKELLTHLNRIKDAYQLSPHPFFGSLSRKEWGQLIYKHLDHHLKQFSQ